MPLAKPVHGAGLRVLALIADRNGSARLRAAFGDLLDEFVAQPELVAASRGGGVGLVIVTPTDRAGRSLSAAVAAIHASRRSAPTYVYCDCSAASVRELMPLARAGARGLILATVDDDAASLHKLLDRGSLYEVVAVLAGAAQRAVSRRHLPLVMHCLEHLDAPVSAALLARRLRVSRRTLSGWASKAGSRGVRSLTSKVRVLAAVEMLRVSGRTIESIAHELQFGSSAHLHNTIRRYTGLRPREAARYDAEFWARQFFAGTRGTVVRPLPPGEESLPHAEWRNRPNDPTLSPTIQAQA